MSANGRQRCTESFPNVTSDLEEDQRIPLPKGDYCKLEKDLLSYIESYM